MEASTRRGQYYAGDGGIRTGSNLRRSYDSDGVAQDGMSAEEAKLASHVDTLASPGAANFECATSDVDDDRVAYKQCACCAQ